MASLADKLKQAFTQGNRQLGQNVGQDSVQGIQQAMSAKSGKAAAPGSAPGVSSLAQDQAVANTQAAIQQVNQTGNVQMQQQAAQSADQLQSANIAQQQQQQKARAFDQQAGQQFTKLMADKDEARRLNDFRQSNLIDERIGTLERIGNEKYVQELQLNGARSRLDDQNAFELAMVKDYLGGMEDLFQNNLAFKSMMSANDRDFNMKVAQMDVGMALELLKQGIRAESDRAMYEGLGGIASAGAKAYADYKPATTTPIDSGKLTEDTSYDYNVPLPPK